VHLPNEAILYGLALLGVQHLLLPQQPRRFSLTRAYRLICFGVQPALVVGCQDAVQLAGVEDLPGFLGAAGVNDTFHRASARPDLACIFISSRTPASMCA